MAFEADGDGYQLVFILNDSNDRKLVFVTFCNKMIDASESTHALGMTGYPQFYANSGESCPVGDIVPSA